MQRSVYGDDMCKHSMKHSTDLRAGEMRPKRISVSKCIFTDLFHAFYRINIWRGGGGKRECIVAALLAGGASERGLEDDWNSNPASLQSGQSPALWHVCLPALSTL